MKFIYVAVSLPRSPSCSSNEHSALLRQATSAVEKLVAAGYGVECPYLDKPTFPDEEAMFFNLQLVTNCDGVYSLPVLEQIPTLCCEESFAQALGIPVFRDIRSLTAATMVIGLPRSGKTTFLSVSCCPGNDCSARIIEALDHYPATRSLKIYAGDTLCEHRPCKLSLACLQRGPVVGGVRRRREYRAIRPWFKHVVWIDRPGNPPIEDNTEVKREDATVIIENSSSVEDFKCKARDFLRSLELL